MNFPELDVLRISVSPAARQRHLSAISNRLAERSPGTNRRKRLMVVLVAAALALPVAALAAESAVPGDPLYSVKRVFEPVRELFDRDVVAVNRVEELEMLVERIAPRQVIARQAQEAEVAVARSDRDDLRRRLAEALERQTDRSAISDPATTNVDRPEPVPTTVSPASAPPATDAPTNTAPPDRTTTTVTPSTRP